MAWYRNGTISVTNGSATVTGSGTLWVDAGVLNIGDITAGPDGKLYEILSIQSNTELTLASNYLGSTASGQSYAIMPIGLLPSALAQQVKTTLASANTALQSAILSTAGQSLTSTQQANARANIAALGAGDIGKGYLSKSVAGGVDVTLSTVEDAAEQLELTGTLTANINVIVSTTARQRKVKNSTSGAYTVTVKTASGTGLVVGQGKGWTPLACDGTNVVNPVANIPGGLTVAGAGTFSGLAKAEFATGTTAPVAKFGSTDQNRGVWLGIGADGNALIQAYRQSDGNTAAGFTLNIGVANSTVLSLGAGSSAFTGTLSVDAAQAGDTGSSSSTRQLFTAATSGSQATAATLRAYGIIHPTVYSVTLDSSTGSGAAAPLAFSGALGSSEYGRFDASGTLLVGVSSGSFHTIAKNSVENYVLSAQNLATSGGAHCMYTKLGYSPNDTTSSLYIGGDTTTTRFVVWSNGNVQNTNNSYGAISDLKLKQDIVDAKSQWADIKALTVRKFRLKIDPTGPLMMGLIAQEAEQVSPGLIETTDDYEDVVVEPARTEVKIVQRQKTRKVTIEQPTPTLVDGRYVLSMESTEIDEPLFDEYPLYAEDGSPIMEIVEPEHLAVTDDESNVVTPAKPAVIRQAVHRVPVMEDVEETVEIPAKTERRPTGTQTKSVKYSILYMKAVKALQEAMERIEVLEGKVAELVH